MSADPRAEIIALLHEYAERLDAGDLDGVAALFEHADYGSPQQGRIRGAAEVRKVYEPVILHDDGTPRTKHVISNVTVDVDPVAGTATSRSYFTVLQALPDLPLQPIIAGRYQDRFERAGGGWRFAERMILPDLVGDLSRHMRGVRL